MSYKAGDTYIRNTTGGVCEIVAIGKTSVCINWHKRERLQVFGKEFFARSFSRVTALEGK